MVTDENGRNHCSCKYCGGKPKLIHGVLNDFIECDDCRANYANWEEFDAAMEDFQDQVVKISDIVKYGDITNWDHPYGISYKKLNEVPRVEVATEVVRNAYWLPRQDSKYVECSQCGFQVENHRAVELGVDENDFLEVKYCRCPICEARMHIKKKGK